MSLDAICLRAVVDELAAELIGARIDKVQQPSRDQIVLTVRGKDRVLLSANPNQPRIQFTREPRDNSAQPPMFCMLLRKHISDMNPVEAMNTIHDRMLHTRNNEEFLLTMNS